ncbi:MAG: hypothetical protein IPH69_06465 [Bacteroidales bacterium]|nr:hypothetical protein [Bacteroidales bacterium]
MISFFRFLSGPFSFRKPYGGTSNENHGVERIPKALFKGRSRTFHLLTFSKDRAYEVTVEGDLTIHNVTNKISTKGTIEIAGGINATSNS